MTKPQPTMIRSPDGHCLLLPSLKACAEWLRDIQNDITGENRPSLNYHGIKGLLEMDCNTFTEGALRGWSIYKSDSAKARHFLFKNSVDQATNRDSE